MAPPARYPHTERASSPARRPYERPVRRIGAPTSARVIADAVVRILGADMAHLTERFAAAGGLVRVAASGEASWHGLAAAIVEGLRGSKQRKMRPAD
jgi:dTDP-4-dehydrorhamnose reductase